MTRHLHILGVMGVYEHFDVTRSILEAKTVSDEILASPI